MAQEAVDVAGADVLALSDACVKFLEHFACNFARLHWACQGYDIAMGMRLDAQAFLQQCQMPIVFAEKAIEVAIVPNGTTKRACSALGTLPNPVAAGPRTPVN